jgi:glutaredoxin
MTTVAIALVVAIVVTTLAYLAILYTGGGLLSMDGFSDKSGPTFTMYYMNGCPHCEKIKPDFEKFVASGQVLTKGQPVKIRMLEQGEAASDVKSLGIQGFPSFYLSTTDGNEIEYTGDRTVPAYTNFIKQNAS